MEIGYVINYAMCQVPRFKGPKLGEGVVLDPYMLHLEMLPRPRPITYQNFKSLGALVLDLW